MAQYNVYRKWRRRLNEHIAWCLIGGTFFGQVLALTCRAAWRVAWATDLAAGPTLEALEDLLRTVEQWRLATRAIGTARTISRLQQSGPSGR